MCDVISLAASQNTLYAITTDQQIWSHNIGNDAEAWAKLDRPTKVDAGDSIDQIRVSRDGAFIWVFSTKSGHCWTKSASSPNGRLKSSSSWIRVGAPLRVADLAVGETAVWCIEAGTNELHRLRTANLVDNHPSDVTWKPMGIYMRLADVRRVI